MNAADAMTVARRMRRETLTDNGRLVLHARVEGDRLVFLGGRFGAASIALDVSSEERALAHWDGYCVANGLRAKPEVGERVGFFRGGHRRRGVAVAVGPRRVRISFTYRNGRKSEVALPFGDVSFGVAPRVGGAR